MTPRSPIFSRSCAPLLCAAAILTPLLFFTGFNDTYDLPKMLFIYLIAAALATFWAFEKKMIFARSALDFPLLGFVGAAAVVTCFSVDRSLSFHGTYRIYAFGLLPFCALAVLFCAATQVASIDLRRYLAWGILLASALSGLYAILQYTGYEWFEEIPRVVGGRPWSSVGNPVYLGAICMMALPLALSLLLDKGLRFSVVLLSAGVLSGLALSLSRSAWCGAMAGCGVTIFLARREGRSTLRPILFLTGAALFFLAFLPAVRGRARVLLARGEGSNASRIAGWKAAGAIWQEHPLLGTGPDTFAAGFRRHHNLEYVRATGAYVVQAHAHNDFLQFAATEGALGLAGYSWIIVTLGVVLLRKKSTDLYTVGGVGMLVALFVQNQFNFSSMTTSVWAAIGIGVSLPTWQSESPRSPVMRQALSIGAFCLAGLFIVEGSRLAVGDRYYKLALIAQANKQTEAELLFARRAVAWNSFNELYKSEWANAARSVALQSTEPRRSDLFNEAWMAAERAVRDHPASPDAWNNKGVAAMWMTQLANQNKMAEAQIDFEQAVERDPLFVDAWANLAKWRHLAGDPDGEKKIWERVLQIDPTHAFAKEVLGR